MYTINEWLAINRPDFGEKPRKTTKNGYNGHLILKNVADK